MADAPTSRSLETVNTDDREETQEKNGEAEEIVFQTIANLAKVEGVFLDPVYTGKAFHGMVSELSLGDRGRLQGAKNIVFIHTGGLFGVFPQHKNFQFD